jgi:hypothetical protein
VAGDLHCFRVAVKRPDAILGTVRRGSHVANVWAAPHSEQA